MKIGDLVTLREEWYDPRVSTFGIIIDLEEDFYVRTGPAFHIRPGMDRASVRWFNTTQTYEPTVALEILSEL